jgi:hypothetical protein
MKPYERSSISIGNFMLRNNIRVFEYLKIELLVIIETIKPQLLCFYKHNTASNLKLNILSS